MYKKDIVFLKIKIRLLKMEKQTNETGVLLQGRLKINDLGEMT